MKRGEAIPEQTRWDVYSRDNKRCRLCGISNAYTYSVHHICYRSEGGTNDLENLVLLCGSGSTGCHLKVHSDKGLYQPLLVELVHAPGITGLALMRSRIRAGTASNRPGSSGVSSASRDRTISRFLGQGGSPLHPDGDRKQEP